MMYRKRSYVGQLALYLQNVTQWYSTLTASRTTLCAVKQWATAIMHQVHSATVPLLGTTPLRMPISVGYLSPIEIKDNANTSGAMQQVILTLVMIYVTAHVQFMLAEQPRHLLAVIVTVSLALAEHHPDSGTPPTHSGMAKAATW